MKIAIWQKGYKEIWIGGFCLEINSNWIEGSIFYSNKNVMLFHFSKTWIIIHKIISFERNK